MTVEILVHHIHHDPDYWTDPETFNPDRKVCFMLTRSGT